jgi:hypothetical protein
MITTTNDLGAPSGHTGTVNKKYVLFKQTGLILGAMS